MSSKYEFINTPRGVQTAYDALRTCPYIFLDCEGRDLGTKSGALGLIQLGTPNAARIFLIDVTVLDATVLEPIYALLKDKILVKVVWDGRMDDSELLFGQKVKMSGVLDLQIVDIVSRRVKYEHEKSFENDRLRRMRRSYMTMSTLKGCQTEGLQVLNSMDRAVIEHGLEGVPKKDASVKSLHLTSRTDFWMERPLSSTVLDYAASDITRIAALYNHFIQKGYIPNPKAAKGKEKQECIAELARLLGQSQRYISRHRTFGRPDGSNMFASSEFLPLGVISGTGPTDQCKKCKSCLRVLHTSCFPFEVTSATTPVVKNGLYVGDTNAPRTSQCRLCAFLDMRAIAKKHAQEQTQAMAAVEAAEHVKAAIPSTPNGLKAETAPLHPQQQQRHSGESTQSTRVDTPPRAQAHSSQPLRSSSNSQTRTPTKGSGQLTITPAPTSTPLNAQQRSQESKSTTISVPARSRSRGRTSQEREQGKPDELSKPAPDLKRRRSQARIQSVISSPQGGTPGTKANSNTQPLITPTKELQASQRTVVSKSTTTAVQATRAVTDVPRNASNVVLAQVAISAEKSKAVTFRSDITTDTMDFGKQLNHYRKKIVPTVKA